MLARITHFCSGDNRKIAVRIAYLALVLALAITVLPAQAAVPQTLNYQGQLASAAGVPVNAAVNITFKLYDVGIGGVVLWSETQSVTVTNGLYSVTLGQTTPLTPALFGVPLYLGISVGADAEMAQRIAMSSSATALRAAVADSISCTGCVSADNIAAGSICTAGDQMDCYTGVSATRNVGACKSGKRNCSPAGWGSTCGGEVLPVAEMANGIDDDCNGVTDNGVFANGEACLTAVSCGSGFCVDGLCSNAACTGGCQSNLVVPGTCTIAPSGQDPRNACAPYVCNGTSASCPTSCAMNADCNADYICAGGVCSKRTIGAACSADSQCSSSFCTDGVCSNTRCGGVCERANLPGSVGTCSPIPAGQDPDAECAGQPASSCGTTGMCNGASACQLYSSGTICVAASCSGGVSNPADTCDGLGVCRDAGAQSCLPYSCNPVAGACYMSCASDSQCASGSYCSSSAACVAKKLSGQACSAANECVSGTCTGNVCQ